MGAKRLGLKIEAKRLGGKRLVTVLHRMVVSGLSCMKSGCLFDISILRDFSVNDIDKETNQTVLDRKCILR